MALNTKPHPHTAPPSNKSHSILFKPQVMRGGFIVRGILL